MFSHCPCIIKYFPYLRWIKFRTRSRWHDLGNAADRSQIKIETWLWFTPFEQKQQSWAIFRSCKYQLLERTFSTTESKFKEHSSYKHISKKGAQHLTKTSFYHNVHFICQTRKNILRLQNNKWIIVNIYLI